MFIIKRRKKIVAIKTLREKAPKYVDEYGKHISEMDLKTAH